MLSEIKNKLVFLSKFSYYKSLILLISMFLFFHFQYFFLDLNLINYSGFFVVYVICISFHIYVLFNLIKSYNFLKNYIDFSKYEIEFNSLIALQEKKYNSFADIIYHPLKISFNAHGKVSTIDYHIFNKDFKLKYENFNLKKSNQEFISFMIDNDIIPFRDQSLKFQILDLNFSK